MFASLFVVTVGLCFCSKESNQSFLGTPFLSGPSEALVKQIAEFQCELQNPPKNETVLLQLFKKGNHNKSLGEYSSLAGEVGIFNLVIRPVYEGYLECVATLQNKTKLVQDTVSNTHYLKVIEPVKGANIIPPGPVEFFEGKTLELVCQVTTGSHASYKWMMNNQLISHSPFHILSNNHLLIYRTTSIDSGSYVCEAYNHFNNTIYSNSTSSEVHITVKDVVSNPDIAFTVLKEGSHNYSALVTCQSTRGTPPVTLSLYNRNQQVGNVTGEDRNAIFKVPVVLNQHMGYFQCQADNGDQTGYSNFLPLEVVPVGGHVKMHYDYHSGDNYAVVGVVFYCKVERGSHPWYEWFHNDTLLHERGSFYYVVKRPPVESLLILSVGRSSAGTYRCEVSDSFDNTTAISSKTHYLDKEVLNRLPVLVVAVVFACFTLLIVLVSVCCWAGVVFRRRRFGKNSLLGLDMEKKVIMYEGELDVEEEEDLVKTPSGDEFDQVSAASEASVDEWPQIMSEKKTLEDEPIEFQ